MSREKIDRYALQDELTKGFIYFIMSQHQPSLAPPSTAAQIDAYRNDPAIHVRVQSLVAGVMQVMEKHLQNYEHATKNRVHYPDW